MTPLKSKVLKPEEIPPGTTQEDVDRVDQIILAMDDALIRFNLSVVALCLAGLLLVMLGQYASLEWW